MSRRSTRTEKPAPAESDLNVTPEEGRIEDPVIESVIPDPVNLETETPSEEPAPAPEPCAPEKIQTNVREKLSSRSIEENIFVPSNPAELEKAASQISQEMGFELNRGTSIGARLLARAQSRPQ